MTLMRNDHMRSQQFKNSSACVHEYCLRDFALFLGPDVNIQGVKRRSQLSFVVVVYGSNITDDASV